MDQMTIKTGRPYPLFLGQGCLEQTASLIGQVYTDFQRVVIVTDDNVAPLYLDKVAQTFPSHIQCDSFIVPHGEGSKSSTQLFALYDFLTQKGITRKDLLIALGGGVVGDLTGYCASSYLRGVPFVQIPTTLLAQVDSSVGGKTAINIPAGKNLVGSFYQPIAVICDTTALQTLTDQDFHDGVAEVIKYGCIYDAELFEQISQIRQPEVLTSIIARCIAIKAEVVAADEFDTGKRMILNFGHTLGHAMEKYHHFADCTHGQGVAAGMVHLTRLTEQIGWTKPGTADRIAKLAAQFSLPQSCDVPLSFLLDACRLDKKNDAKGIHLITLTEIGHCEIKHLTADEFERLVKTPLVPGYDAMITPSNWSGTVSLPPSKSVLHRAMICAALAPGKSVLRHVTFSEDIAATMDCLSALGATFVQDGDTLEITGITTPPDQVSLHCRESGSTLRFLIPLTAALGIDTTYQGSGRLVTRPLTVYEEVLPRHGVTVSYQGQLPFTTEGKLQPGHYTVAGNISSQFITGLLLALPLLHQDSMIEVLPPFESESYVEITLQVLSKFGIRIAQQGHTFIVFGNQSYRPITTDIESDYSQAAFFLTAAAFGQSVTCGTFSAESKQGDRAIVDVLAKAGVSVKDKNSHLTVQKGKLLPFHIDAADIPDLVPILCVLACACDGTSTISHVERLRYKESDRIEATLQCIQALGGEISYQDGTLTVVGGKPLTGGEVDSCNDHRIAMCAAVASLLCQKSVTVRQAQCIKKSYPAFWWDVQTLGGQVSYLPR